MARGLLLAGAMLSTLVLLSSLAVVPPTAEEYGPHDTKRSSVGVHLGLNGGLLAVDLHHDPVTVFGSFNLGLLGMTGGSWAVGAFGAGPSFMLANAERSGVALDTLLLLPVGSFGLLTPSPQLGVGLAVGIRYLHGSGFTLSFRVPIAGVLPSQVERSLPLAMIAWWVQAAAGTPLASVGWRF